MHFQQLNFFKTIVLKKCSNYYVILTKKYQIIKIILITHVFKEQNLHDKLFYFFLLKMITFFITKIVLKENLSIKDFLFLKEKFVRIVVLKH